MNLKTGLYLYLHYPTQHKMTNTLLGVSPYEKLYVVRINKSKQQNPSHFGEIENEDMVKI